MTEKLAALLPLLPPALICALALLAVAERFKAGSTVRLAILVLTILICLAPVAPVSAATWIRGVIGDLSVPSVILVIAATISILRGRPFIAVEEKRWLAAIFGSAALFLYPCALGLSPFDPYALGFRPLALVTVVLAVAAAAVARRRYLTSVALLAAVLAFSFGAMESTNLWDYVIDPGLGGYTLVAGARMAAGPMLAAPAIERWRS